MTDREKVLKGLECCTAMNGDECRKCPYSDECEIDSLDGMSYLAGDALALLKEQEAVKPKLVGPSMWRCGKCEALLGWEEFARSGVELVEYKFCPECGRPVKWDA